MAVQNNKPEKKVKKKKAPINEVKSPMEKKVEKKKSTNSNEKPVVKKKLKRKPKSEVLVENNNEKQKQPISTGESDKIVDERTLGVSLETELKENQTIKPESTLVRDERINYLTGKGKSHPVHELRQKLREILLNSGFNELESQYFIPERDIFEQYNSRSGLVLDKTYYLAENKKQKIDIEPEQIQQLQDLKTDSEFDHKQFVEILNEYNENKIEFYQLFLRFISDLGLNNNDLNKIIEVFPQLCAVNPRLTHTTLRSNMGLSWLTTLAAIVDKENLPVKAFSMGIYFKREEKQSESHLLSHYGASCIIMDDEITVNNGKVIAEEILYQLGFEELEFKGLDRTMQLGLSFKELEVYCNNLKIATCGRFSKKTLKKFGIDIPILYINFGLERMVMVQKGIDDIRELMYPQFYKAWKLTDQDIAMAIQYIQTPITKLGSEIATNLYNVCLNNLNKISPCEFTVWEGIIKIQSGKPNDEKHVVGSDNEGKTEIKSNSITIVETSNDDLTGSANSADDNVDAKLSGVDKKRLIVKVYKKEKDSKLCGPAALNEIVVKKGDIYGVQNLNQSPEMAGAIKTNISYLAAFSKLVGNIIETKLFEGITEDILEIKSGIVKDMEEINLQLDGRAVRYIMTNKKKIDVRGPMFVNVEYRLEKLAVKKSKKNHQKNNEKPIPIKDEQNDENKSS